jgi:uncharacterized LabA/DUF88 family protein
MFANYFFIDGSALTAQIRQLRRVDPSFRDRRLCPIRLMRYLISSMRDLHAGEYKRCTFYFPKGDETAIEEYLVMPDHKKPGQIRDLHFKFCGQKLKRTREFIEFVETSVPPHFQDRFSKSEKGIDIEICCDALKLASASRLERLFLFTNDDDFLPFCRTIKEFGANISIIHLSDAITQNVSLLREADSYDVIPRESLQQMFLPLLEPTPPGVPIAEAEAAVSALKPDVAPSDMALDPGASSAGSEPLGEAPEAES